MKIREEEMKRPDHGQMMWVFFVWWWTLNDDRTPHPKMMTVFVRTTKPNENICQSALWLWLDNFTPDFRTTNKSNRCQCEFGCNSRRFCSVQNPEFLSSDTVTERKFLLGGDLLEKWPQKPPSKFLWPAFRLSKWLLSAAPTTKVLHLPQVSNVDLNAEDYFILVQLFSESSKLYMKFSAKIVQFFANFSNVRDDIWDCSSESHKDRPDNLACQYQQTNTKQKSSGYHAVQEPPEGKNCSFQESNNLSKMKCLHSTVSVYLLLIAKETGLVTRYCYCSDFMTAEGNLWSEHVIHFKLGFLLRTSNTTVILFGHVGSFLALIGSFSKVASECEHGWELAFCNPVDITNKVGKVWCVSVLLQTVSCVKELTCTRSQKSMGISSRDRECGSLWKVSIQPFLLLHDSSFDLFT